MAARQVIVEIVVLLAWLIEQLRNSNVHGMEDHGMLQSMGMGEVRPKAVINFGIASLKSLLSENSFEFRNGMS